LETELIDGTELANTTLAELAVDKPMLAEETGGNTSLELDSEYVSRGGTPATTDFTAVALLLPGRVTKTAERPLSAAFLMWEFIRPNAVFCEPTTS